MTAGGGARRPGASDEKKVDDMQSSHIRDKGLILLGAVAMAATALGVLAVFSRYAFSLTFGFSDEVVTYLIVWGTLIAFGMGEFLDEHLRATILVDKLSPRARRALARLCALLGLAFAGLLAWFGIEVAWQRHLFNEVSPTVLQFPQWIARASVPAGFAIAFAALLLRARAGRKGDEA